MDDFESWKLTRAFFFAFIPGMYEAYGKIMKRKLYNIFRIIEIYHRLESFPTGLPPLHNRCEQKNFILFKKVLNKTVYLK